jgi:hypothetical protein
MYTLIQHEDAGEQMSEENERRPRGLYEKINALRGDVVKMDWTKDGYASFGKTSYKYLPTDKIKANLAPYFHKRGLELQIKFYGLQFLPAVGNMTQHVVLILDATVIDIDSGESMTDTVYGEAADSGDKAIGKAQTYAIKSWASNKFLIADGMDPDEVESTGNVFRPKSNAETEEVRSKVLEQGVPPTPQAPAVPKAPAVPAKAPAEPVEAPKVESEPEIPAAPEKPAEAVPEPVAEQPKAPAPMEDQPPKFKISAAQQKAIKKITDSWEKAAKEGKVDAEQYNAMSMACASISSTAEAMEFINTYKM